MLPEGGYQALPEVALRVDAALQILVDRAEVGQAHRADEVERHRAIRARVDLDPMRLPGPVNLYLEPPVRVVGRDGQAGERGPVVGHQRRRRMPR